MEIVESMVYCINGIRDFDEKLRDIGTRGLVEAGSLAVATGTAFQVGGAGYAVGALTAYCALKGAGKFIRARNEKIDMDFGDVLRVMARDGTLVRPVE